MQSVKENALMEILKKLEETGVRFIRLLYPDLHGVPRGKIVSIDSFPDSVKSGVAFATGIMPMDLRHNVYLTIEEGIPDLHAIPDPTTLVQVPWEPQYAWCICDLEDPTTKTPFLIDPRNTLKQAAQAFKDIGYTPEMAAELEFYLMKADDANPGRFERYADLYSPVYTFGAQADPQRIVERMFEHTIAMGLKGTSAFHEYGRSQYEINLQHSEALDSADRAFRFKTLVKEVASHEGVVATFMGKPWNGDEGSGFHLHISLKNEKGENVLWDPGKPDGLSDIALHFVAGLLKHMPAVMAFLNPTINAYRRIHMGGLVPTHINWGYDHRFALVRIPPERDAATRIEIRIGDGSANPYLAYAAVLWAGFEGVKQHMQPQEPIAGLLDELPKEVRGEPVPADLNEALNALERDPLLKERMGNELVTSFLTVKREELQRYRQWTTEWELAEYAPRL